MYLLDMYKFNISNTHCSPSINEKGKFKTCYSKESLIKISEELKKKNKDKINLNKKSKKNLWDYIQKKI